MIPPRTPDTIRLMTWNIHGGIGPDGRFDLGRIAALVARHAPDILALQEIDTRGRGPACLVPLRTSHWTPDHHFAEARTITAPDGHYGHVLFSRWPVITSSLHDLSIGQREPRAAIEAVVATGQGPLHLLAVHLGLALAERGEQAARLAQILARQKGMATLAMGDFNDYFWFGRVRRALAPVLPQRTSIRTFPARWPLLKLDRIYCDATSAIVRCWTDHSARACSDHLPVLADLRLATAKPPVPHQG